LKGSSRTASDHDFAGLVYLNNRYHDPTLGHFISVDPLVGKTGQPYLYANGTPVTLSDPSGLDPGWAHDNDPCNDAGYYKCAAPKAGPNAGNQVVVGPGRRQLLEKAFGIGLPVGCELIAGCAVMNNGTGQGISVEDDTDLCAARPELCDFNAGASGLSPDDELAVVDGLAGLSPEEFLDLAMDPTEIKRRGLGWLDWSNDGCSNSPDSVNRTSLLGPCSRHDFEYRNLRALEWSHDSNYFSQDRRRSADDRFGDGIRGVCGWQCDHYSFVYWMGVHAYGDGGPIPFVGGSSWNPNPLPWDGFLPLVDWGWL